MPKERTSELVDLTPEMAMENIGFELAVDGEYKFDDGTKFILTKNKSNRRMKDRRYLRYTHAMLSGNWRVTLESITHQHNGCVVSGASRYLGLIFAQHLVDTDPEYARSIGWNGKPLKLFDTNICYGVSADAADCTDTGETRKAGDVLFRVTKFFPEENASSRDSLCRELGVAIRLAYLRVNSMTVAGSPQLEHWELTYFLQQNQGIMDSLVFLNGINNVAGEKKRITSKIGLGYASAILYLASCQSGKFLKKDFTTCCKFWSLFAENLHPKANTIRSLWNVLNSAKAKEIVLSRDELVRVCIRAMYAWIHDPESNLSTKQLTGQSSASSDHFEGLDYSVVIEKEEPKEEIKEEVKEETAA